jgi:hypothetical protein
MRKNHSYEALAVSKVKPNELAGAVASICTVTDFESGE